jgi:glycosyltransferase involved in cell wall biosynthesis
MDMDLLVFSHLRWDFVYQRPQHLLSRFAKHRRVFFWEEPVYREVPEPFLDRSSREGMLEVIVPQMPIGTSEQESLYIQQQLLGIFLQENAIKDYVAWYYTPMSRNFTRELEPHVTVYDCMDQLSGFRGAPPGLTAAESELFGVADLVFTGGQSLYESKQSRHHSVHLFPSSIDTTHFGKARESQSDPQDQAIIPHPRIGYCGVIDERMDLDLLRGIAVLRPDWHLVMVGPVVKITQQDLPTAENIHYLGSKKYQELPTYMAGWDIGMLPFASNESTRFISPTKTPEYLAAGLPSVSTPITDVVRPYGNSGLVEIASDAESFVSAVDRLLSRDRGNEEQRLSTVGAFLARSSWDRTFTEMERLIMRVASGKKTKLQALSEKHPGSAIAAD